MEDLTYPHELIKIAENLVDSKNTKNRELNELANFLRDLTVHKNGNIKKPIKTELSNLTLELERLQSKKELDLNLGLIWLVNISILTMAVRKKIPIQKITAKEPAVELIINLVNSNVKDALEAKDKLDELSNCMERLNIPEIDADALELLLYFAYANRYKSYKKEFLLKHYESVKKLTERYSNLYIWFKNRKSELLTDNYMIGLLRAAIALSGCGYNEALRLPKIEEINYSQKIIDKETITKTVDKAYDDTVKEAYNVVKTIWWSDMISNTILRVLPPKKISTILFDVMGLIMLIIFLFSYNPYFKTPIYSYIALFLSVSFIVTSITVQIKFKERLIEHLQR